jgi:hypothetical protein
VWNAATQKYREDQGENIGARRRETNIRRARPLDAQVQHLTLHQSQVQHLTLHQSQVQHLTLHQSQVQHLTLDQSVPSTKTVTHTPPPMNMTNAFHVRSHLLDHP